MIDNHKECWQSNTGPAFSMCFGQRCSKYIAVSIAEGRVPGNIKQITKQGPCSVPFVFIFDWIYWVLYMKLLIWVIFFFFLMLWIIPYNFIQVSSFCMRKFYLTCIYMVSIHLFRNAIMPMLKFTVFETIRVWGL